MMLLSALVLLLGSAGAQADWEGTRWGMSVREVLAATGDAARPATAAEARAAAVGDGAATMGVVMPYRLAGLELDLQFHFTAAGLAIVRTASVSGAECGRLLAALGDRHGEPEYLGQPGGFESWAWRDLAAGNRVVLILLGPADASGDCFFGIEPA